MTTEPDRNEINQKKLGIATLIIAGGLIASAMALLLIPTDYDESELLLGYNKDGYFCKVINQDKYVPLKECSGIMKRTLIAPNKTLGDGV